MSGKIRLGCNYCDRDDFDGIDELPSDWTFLEELQSYEESILEVDPHDGSRSPLDWETHGGVCPECQTIRG